MSAPVERADAWGQESPITGRISLPPPPIADRVFTIAAFGGAEDDEKVICRWQEWFEILMATAGQVLAGPTWVVANESLGQHAYPLSWWQAHRAGDFAVELSRLFWGDHTIGLRLVNRQAGAVLHYEPETWSTQVNVSVFDNWPIESSLTVLVDEPLVETEEFVMEVDPEALLAMDASDQEADERYRAAQEREARALRYTRD